MVRTAEGNLLFGFSSNVPLYLSMFWHRLVYNILVFCLFGCQHMILLLCASFYVDVSHVSMQWFSVSLMHQPFWPNGSGGPLGPPVIISACLKCTDCYMI